MDIWATGIVAIELAERRPPHWDMEPMQVICNFKIKNNYFSGLFNFLFFQQSSYSQTTSSKFKGKNKMVACFS